MPLSLDPEWLTQATVVDDSMLGMSGVRNLFGEDSPKVSGEYALPIGDTQEIRARKRDILEGAGREVRSLIQNLSRSETLNWDERPYNDEDNLKSQARITARNAVAWALSRLLQKIALRFEADVVTYRKER